MDEQPEHYEPTPRAAAGAGASAVPSWLLLWMVLHTCVSGLCLAGLCLAGAISTDAALSAWGFSLPVAYGGFVTGRRYAPRG